jgi:hypothetical protein
MLSQLSIFKPLYLLCCSTRSRTGCKQPRIPDVRHADPPRTHLVPPPDPAHPSSFGRRPVILCTGLSQRSGPNIACRRHGFFCENAAGVDTDRQDARGIRR